MNKSFDLYSRKNKNSMLAVSKTNREIIFIGLKRVKETNISTTCVEMKKKLYRFSLVRS